MKNKKLVAVLCFGVVLIVGIVLFVSRDYDHVEKDYTIRYDGVVYSGDDYIDKCFQISYGKTEKDCAEEFEQYTIESVAIKYNNYVSIIEQGFPEGVKPLVEHTHASGLGQGGDKNLHLTGYYSVTGEDYDVYGDQWVTYCKYGSGKTLDECIDDWNTETDTELMGDYNDYAVSSAMSYAFNTDESADIADMLEEFGSHEFQE